MTNILVHGLGQDEKSWNQVKNQLNNNGINVETPNLFSVVKNNQVNYENMYKTFADYCNSFNEKINLVGLSLGGVLAVDYITEFPEKINSIILIGTPYEIPKIIFTIQNIIYKFMPKRIFEKMGCPKKDIIRLLDSMKNLSICMKDFVLISSSNIHNTKTKAKILTAAIIVINSLESRIIYRTIDITIPIPTTNKLLLGFSFSIMYTYYFIIN